MSTPKNTDSDTETVATTPPAEEIVFTPTSVRQLREDLVQTDELERTSFVKCARSGRRLLVTEVRTVPDDKMLRQGRTECRPELEVERREIHQTIDAGWTVLHMHSHPFTDLPRFSSADTRIMPKVARWTNQMYDESDILFAVLGRRGIQATWYNATADEFISLPVTVLGGWDLDTPLAGATHSRPAQTAQQADLQTTVDVDTRFDRHYRAFGEEGQRRLLAADVTVVGAGGLSSSIAEQLARVGVGAINLVDPDYLEQSNLPRVYGAYETDVDVPKVEALRLHLKRINSELDVTTHETVVEADDVAPVLKRSDAVVAGLDRMRSRSFLNQFCVRHGIPYFDAGVVINTETDADEAEPDAVDSMDGFLQTVIPGTTACFDCLDRIDPQQTRVERLPEEDVDVEVDEGYVEGAALAPEPAVVTLNTTVAGMAVSELVGYITGMRPPRGFLHYEALENEISLLDARGSRTANCPTCGTAGVLFHGDVVEPGDTELPDTVDDDLESIPTPDRPTGADPTDAAINAEPIQDGGMTPAITASSDESTSTAETQAPSPSKRTAATRNGSLNETMRGLSTYVKEVLPWN